MRDRDGIIASLFVGCDQPRIGKFLYNGFHLFSFCVRGNKFLEQSRAACILCAAPDLDQSAKDGACKFLFVVLLILKTIRQRVVPMPYESRRAAR